MNKGIFGYKATGVKLVSSGGMQIGTIRKDVTICVTADSLTEAASIADRYLSKVDTLEFIGDILDVGILR